MKKVLILAGVLIYSCLSWSQASLADQVSKAKYEIIKETVEFLATDLKAFPNSQKKKCSECISNNYEILKKYADANKLVGVSKLILEFEKKELARNETEYNTSLKKFEETLKNRITKSGKGSEDRTYRKNMPGFKSYELKISQIIEGVKVANNQVEKNVTIPSGEKQANQKDNEGGDSLYDAKRNEEVEGVSNKNETINSDSYEDKSGVSQVVLYGVILLLLCIIAFLVYRGTKAQAEILKRESKINSLNQTIDYGKSNENSTSENLKAEIKKLNEENERLKQSLVDERRKVERIQQQTDLPVQATIPDRSSTYISAPPKSFNQPEQPVLKYARYADQGDGFSVSELLNEEDGETIFVIKPQTSTTAQFYIAGNSSAQKLALADISYFMGKTCKYETPPSGNSKIITSIPGELKLLGSKWQIVSPAIISFV